MKAAPEEQVEAAQPNWGAAEQGPQVTEKGGVGQEAALVAGSQSSPQAAGSPSWVEASVTRNMGLCWGQKKMSENLS